MKQERTPYGAAVSHWLDRATEQIRFAPDRTAVRRELEAHIADRMDSARAQGLDDAAARKAALSAMGDPAEVARELGHIHAPLWGYLRRCSQWLLVLMALWLAVTLVDQRHDLLPDYYHPTLPASAGSVYTYTTAAGEHTVHVLDTWEPEGSISLRGYQLSVPCAWTEEYVAHDEIPHYRLMICLESRTWRLWEPGSGDQWMILAHTVTDDQGHRYLRQNQAPDNNLFCSTYQSGPASICYELVLELNSPADIPAQLDIPLGYSGDVLRLDLETEEVTLP